MLCLSSILLGFLLSSPVRAAYKVCLWTCADPLDYTQFEGDSPDADYYASSCQNLLRVQSLYTCMQDRCTQKQIKDGIAEKQHSCKQYGSVDMLPWSIISNITEKDKDNLPVLNYEDLTVSGSAKPPTFKRPVKLSGSLWTLSKKTNDAWGGSLTTRADYGYAMFGFWGIVILIGVINRIYVLFQLHLVPSSISLTTKRYIATPALFTHHTAQPLGWCIIPPRLQSATLFAFLIINVVLCCVSYDVFSNNLYWAKKDTQIWRYLADRTGCISIANMTLIWAFATRNNVLIWLTGWNFTTFNQFHRWVARIATVEAIIHSVGYTVEAFSEGGKAEYYADWAERYWWMGVIATILMSFLCGLSIYPIRRFFYEAFLLIHILFAALFLASMWYHVEIFEGEYNGYLWPCVAVWAFDRAVRIARIAYHSTGKGVATYNPAANIIHLDVPFRRATPKPGTYYYLYVLGGVKLWESHPFTLSSWNDETLSFTVRPYDGFTNRLRSFTDDQESTSKQLRVLVEGPYGTPHDLRHHESILFVIGGSGITVALSHVRALHDLLRSNTKHSVRRVHLVWAVRDLALFQDLYDRHFSPYWFGEAGLGAEVDVTIDLYVTGSTIRPDTNKAVSDTGSSSPSDILPKEEADLGAITDDKLLTKTNLDKHIDLKRLDGDKLPDGVDLHTHRPDVEAVTIEEAMKYGTEGKKMAIVACGPQRMADDARRAVVEAYGRGAEGADFYPELFNW